MDSSSRLNTKLANISMSISPLRTCLRVISLNFYFDIGDCRINGLMGNDLSLSEVLQKTKTKVIFEFKIRYTCKGRVLYVPKIDFT